MITFLIWMFCILCWLAVGSTVQLHTGVIGGLTFAYQYSSTTKEAAELICMWLIVSMLWPIGKYALDVVFWIGKTLKLKQYH